MSIDELRRLIDAIDRGDAKHYHGDIRDGLLDALRELAGLKETPASKKLDEIRAVLERP